MFDFQALLINAVAVLEPFLLAYWIVNGFIVGLILAIAILFGWLASVVFFSERFNITIQKVSTVYLFIWLGYMLFSLIRLYW